MSNHGGARNNAGRKPMPDHLRKTARSIRLPEWLWCWIDEQENTNRTLLVMDALERVHGHKFPKRGNDE